MVLVLQRYNNMSTFKVNRSGGSGKNTIAPIQVGNVDGSKKAGKRKSFTKSSLDSSPLKHVDKRLLTNAHIGKAATFPGNRVLSMNQKAFLTSLSRTTLPDVEERIPVTISAEKRPVIKRRKNPTIIRVQESKKQIDDGGGRWTKMEDRLLKEAVDRVGPKNWKAISQDYLGGKRSDVQCLHRWQKVLRPGLVKGPWTKEEDDTIIRCVNAGITKWSEIAENIAGRIGKQCRERWFNHLDPNIKKGAWSEQEDNILLTEQKKLGNRWCKIASYLPGRSENAVKNRWNSAMRRKYPNKSTEPDGTRILTMEDMRNTKSGGEIYGQPKPKPKAKTKTKATTKGKEKGKRKVKIDLKPKPKKATKSSSKEGKTTRKKKRSMDPKTKAKSKSKTKAENDKKHSKKKRKSKLQAPKLKHSFSAPAIKTIELPVGLCNDISRNKLRRHNSLSSLGPLAPHNQFPCVSHSNPYSAQMMESPQDPLRSIKPNQRHIDILSNLLSSRGEKISEKTEVSPSDKLALTDRERKLMMHAFLQGVSDEREESFAQHNISNDNFVESKVGPKSPTGNIYNWSLDRDDEVIMTSIVNSQDGIGGVAEKLAAQMKEHLSMQWQEKNTGIDHKMFQLSPAASYRILEDSKPSLFNSLSLDDAANAIPAVVDVLADISSMSISFRNMSLDISL